MLINLNIISTSLSYSIIKSLFPINSFQLKPRKPPFLMVQIPPKRLIAQKFSIILLINNEEINNFLET